ncbi:hypothetical protein HPULCUR_004250 [Helicostylum pulchrum]|uniref:Uncharacterized protein n=1 Tax=Helicostylum pulchrum TaxID=562976 RepID=A0ABP9XVP4_9FUNG
MISQCLLGHEEIGEKYILVNDILSASNHYEALGVSGDSSCDEIRRAYIKFELLRLYELQEEIRSLSYFDVWRRIKLSITIAKVVIQIPLTINSAIKQEDKLVGKYQDEGGLLGLQIEYGLQKVVTMFESSESYASEWVNTP